MSASAMIRPPERSRFSRMRSGKTWSPSKSAIIRCSMSPVSSQACTSARLIMMLVVRSASCSVCMASSASGTSARICAAAAMMSCERSVLRFGGIVLLPTVPGGTGTMPQKRNPKLSQDIIAAAAQIRALVPLALEAMQTEHEADRTTSIMMGRALVPACELTGDMLQRMVVLMDGLQVFPDRMRENLDLSGGLIMAEALMLELGKQIGRQRAHDAVYEAAQASVVESRPFREMLAADPHVAAGLTPPQVESLLDPARYAGLCSQFAERGAARGASARQRSPAGRRID